MKHISLSILKVDLKGKHVLKNHITCGIRDSDTFRVKELKDW